MMGDRFANGDPANDDRRPGRRPAASPGSTRPARASTTAATSTGLRSKLDYIQGLGTDAIWLTPIFKNKAVQLEDGPSAGYHGYWITDFTQVDPHLGTNADLADLVDAAHRTRDEGLLRHHHQPHRRRDRLRARATARRTSRRTPSPYRTAERPSRSTTATTPARRASPTLDPATSFPYTPGARPGRGGPQGPGLAQRPDDVPQPRQHDLHRRGQPVRRLLRPRRPLHRAARGGRRDDRHLPDLGRGLRHRRLPDRHHEARQRRVLAAVRAGPADDRRRPTATRTSSCSARSRSTAATPPRRASPRTTRPTTRCRRSSTSRSRTPPAGSRRRASATQRLADVLRQRRLVHRRRLQRLLAADLPRQPRHGPDRLLPQDRQPRTPTTPSCSPATGSAHELMYLSRGNPVVYYGDEQGFTGTGGDQLARQTMFASQVAGVPGRRPDRHRPHRRRRQLRHRPPALPRDRRPRRAHRASTRRCATAPSRCGSPPTGPGVFAFSRIDRPAAARVRRRAQQQRAAAAGACRRTSARAASAKVYGAGPARLTTDRAPPARRAACPDCRRSSTRRRSRIPRSATAPADQPRAAAAGGGVARPDARRGRTCRAPRSTRSPSSAGSATAAGRRSASTTPRRTRSSTTSRTLRPAHRVGLPRGRARQRRPHPRHVDPDGPGAATAGHHHLTGRRRTVSDDRPGARSRRPSTRSGRSSR